MFFHYKIAQKTNDEGVRCYGFEAISDRSRIMVRSWLDWPRNEVIVSKALRCHCAEFLVCSHSSVTRG